MHSSAIRILLVLCFTVCATPTFGADNPKVAVAAESNNQASPSSTRRAEIVRLTPRPDVEQAYLLLYEPTPVKAVAMLFSGGYALLKFQGVDPKIGWDPQGSSFVVRDRAFFRDRDTAVAIVDVPTDQWNFGMTPPFRKSETHANDIRAVVADLKARFPQAKIFLIGTSQGTTSAAYTGKALGKNIDGVVLTASVFEWAPSSWGLAYDSNLSEFDFSQIQAPLLIVHHADDPCIATPYKSAAKLGAKYPLITVRGGEPVKDNGCGPNGPHGFLGIGKEVIGEIKNWMYGRPFRSEVQ